MRSGKVYLVGAGPGDPGLLTLRGKDVLSKADVVVYDALIHPRILSFIPSKAKKIFRGSRGKSGALKQSQINALLVRLAKTGKNVVRLKGGDSFVFGRGAEEVLALRAAGLKYEVVPGVTSAIAVPAYAGIPVTHRSVNSSFTVVTGHEDPTKAMAGVDWQNLAENKGTLVFLMGLHTLRELTERLMDEGKDPETPAAVIQWGTTSRQRTVRGNLKTIHALTQKEKLVPPAILVVGQVVDLSPNIQWLQHKPLFGTRILVTRTRSQASYLGELMTEEGAEVIEVPTIEIRPLPLDKKGMGLIRKIEGYDWMVFSSMNAVELFMENLKKWGKSGSDLGDAKIACVGSSTAKALQVFGVKAHLVPNDYKQEGLVKAFKKLSWKGKKVLIAGAKEGRDLVLHFLKQKGAKVDHWALYENKAPADARQKIRELFLKQGGVDVLTFASSSSVDNFYALFTAGERKKWLSKLPVAVIGPVTGASAKKWGVKTLIQPSKYTLFHLVEAIGKWVRKNRPFSF